MDQALFEINEVAKVMVEQKGARDQYSFSPSPPKQYRPSPSGNYRPSNNFRAPPIRSTPNNNPSRNDPSAVDSG